MVFCNHHAHGINKIHSVKHAPHYSNQIFSLPPQFNFLPGPSSWHPGIKALSLPRLCKINLPFISQNQILQRGAVTAFTGTMHWGFCDVAPSASNPFLLLLSVGLRYVNVSRFVCPLPRWKTFGLFPVWSDYEQSHYKHPHTGFLVGTWVFISLE